MKNKKHITKAIDWLKLAQDKTPDGGVSAWFSLLNGWQPSYIETTGYIINTFLDSAKYLKDDDLKQRAIRMADFLILMQLENGAYKAYTPQQQKSNKVVVFDIGQDLLGMTQIYEETKKKKYLKSAIKAADFLCKIQENDGSWLQFTYGNTRHTYNTRTAWSLLRVFQISGDNKYKQVAIKNLDWAKNNQLSNGWFDANNFPPPNYEQPFTHNISYAMEGFFWSGLILSSEEYIKVALKTATALLNYYFKHSFLPGTFDSKWESKDRYSCLTGNSQISLIWLELYKMTGFKKFYKGAKKLNRYQKTKQVISPLFPSIDGALSGSYPIWGDLLAKKGYCRMAYLNWATKFFIDALIEEEKI